MFSEALLRPAPARSADAELALAAIERLDAAARGDRTALERLRTELAAAARAVSEAKAALQALAIKPDGDADGKAADPKTAELGALLDELEHRIDAMTEAAGGESRTAQARAPAPPPRSEPAAPPESAAPPKSASLPESAAPLEPAATSGGETAAEPVTSSPSTPLPALSIDRVPTVSAVVSQLGRAADAEDPARASALDAPPLRTAAERGIPTVSMLEALVEALTAPGKDQATEPAGQEAEAVDSILPAMELGPRDAASASDGVGMPDLIEERAQEISQSFAPDGDTQAADEAAQTAALETGGFADSGHEETAALDGVGLAGLDGQAPEQDGQVPAEGEPAAGELAIADLAAGDGAQDGAQDSVEVGAAAFEASGALESLPDTISEPVSEPMPEPPQPGEDLLNSFARTEEFSYMPPDDIGTAVIFSAPSDLPAAEAQDVAGLSGAGVEDGAPGTAEVPAQKIGQDNAQDIAQGIAEDIAPDVSADAPQDEPAPAAGFAEPAPDTAEFEAGDANTVVDQAGATDETPVDADQFAAAPADGEAPPVNWPLAEAKAFDAALQDMSPYAPDANAQAQDPNTQDPNAQDLNAQDLNAQDLNARDLPTYSTAPYPAPLAAEPERRFPRMPQAKPFDPLAPLKTMSEEEKIALFS